MDQEKGMEMLTGKVNFTQIPNVAVQSVVNSAFDFTDEYKKEMPFLDYVTVSHWVAEALLTNHDVNNYKWFVDHYNHVVSEFFKDSIHLLKEICFRASITGVFPFECIDIKDKTDIFCEGNTQFQKESDLELNLFNHLQSFEIEAERQYFIGYGRCDIKMNIDDYLYAIELKKGKANRRDVYQTIEYSLNGSTAKPILIARDFGEGVLDLAESLGVQLFTYNIVTFTNDKVPTGIILEATNKAIDHTELYEILQTEVMDISFKQELNNKYSKLIKERVTLVDTIIKSVEYISNSMKK